MENHLQCAFSLFYILETYLNITGGGQNDVGLFLMG